MTRLYIHTLAPYDFPCAYTQSSIVCSGVPFALFIYTYHTHCIDANADDLDADENSNLRTKKLKETTKLLRSISNPGQTSLPFTIKERCTFYEMEPRDRQFVSRMVVVVTTFIIFLLTIMIVFYILTENGSNK